MKRFQIAPNAPKTLSSRLEDKTGKMVTPPFDLPPRTFIVTVLPSPALGRAGQSLKDLKRSTKGAHPALSHEVHGDF